MSEGGKGESCFSAGNRWREKRTMNADGIPGCVIETGYGTFVGLKVSSP